MPRKDIVLIAVEVRKWDLEANKITLVNYFLIDNDEHVLTFDIGIQQPPEMVEEVLGKLRFEAEKMLQKGKKSDELEVAFDNETFLRQKVYNYFKRITSELNNPRRKKGQTRMILTTHMDVYNENQDVSFLPKRIQFYVVLNWARKYYNRDDWKRAVDPLRQLVKVNSEYGPGFKMLARSLKKIRKYDEAMRMYEKYAEIEKTVEARLDLAKSYRKGKVFDKSETIYKGILKEEPKNKEAHIGLAQILYATKKPEYLDILDELHKQDSGWLKHWLVDEFNFRIYVPAKKSLSAVQAAKFLGFKKIFELTQRAFKNELPSHFNPSKARIGFYKEELENWAMVMNRFKCLPEEISLYPDRIDKEDADLDMSPDGRGNAGKKNGSSAQPATKVEDILTQIRARKAQRLAEEAARAEKPAPSKNGASKKGGPKKKRKKSVKPSTKA